MIQFFYSYFILFYSLLNYFLTEMRNIKKYTLFQHIQCLKDNWNTNLSKRKYTSNTTMIKYLHFAINY